MKFNTFRSAVKRGLAGSLTGILCAVVALLAATPVKAETQTAVLSFNGAPVTGATSNFDCSKLTKITDKVSAGNFTFELQAKTDNGEEFKFKSFNSQGLLLNNATFLFKAADGFTIKNVTLVYSKEILNFKSNDYYPITNIAGPLNHDGGVQFKAPYVAKENNFLILQGAIIEFTGSNADIPATVSDDPTPEVSIPTIPTVANAKVELTADGQTVANGKKLPVGTEVTVTVTPNNPAQYEVTEVKYAGEVIGSADQSTGVWTGTFKLVEGGKLEIAKLETRTYTLSATAPDGVKVTFVNPETGAELTMPVEYGTSVGIKVTDYPLYKQVESISATLNGEAVKIGAGTPKCAATVTVTGDIAVTVTLSDKSAVSVNFQQVAGGTISVTANGNEITSGAGVSKGTTLTITVTPDKGYEIGTLIIEGKKIDLTGNTTSYTIPDNAETVVITATFNKIYPITWEQPENGTMTVTDKDGKEVSSGATFPVGTVLAVKLTPSVGDMITTLSGSGVTIMDAGKNQWTVTINGEAKLTATIGKEIKDYILGIITKVGDTNSSAGGSIKVYDNSVQPAKLISSGSKVKEGTPLKIVVTTNNNYLLESIVYGKNGDDKPNYNEEDGSYTFNMTPYATNLVATFSKIVPNCELTVTIPEAQADMGSVEYFINEGETPMALPAGPITVKQGTVVSLVITTNEGYRIKSVTGISGITGFPVKGPKTGTVTVNNLKTSVTVNFEAIPERTLTLSGINLDPEKLPTGITGLETSPNIEWGVTEVKEGDKITITLIADPEYKITSFTVDNKAGEVASDGASATYDYTVPNNNPSPKVAVAYKVEHRTTSIYFRLNGTDITSMGSVVANYKVGTTTKTISPTTSSQSQSVPTATPMNIVATPKTGYVVESLSINGTAITLDDNNTNKTTHVVTVTDAYTTPTAAETSPGNLTVEVTFKEIPVYYSLTVSITGGKVVDKDVDPYDYEYGTLTITPLPEDMKKILRNTKISFTATAKTNYQIKSITVNGKAEELENKLTQDFKIDAIKQNSTVSVVFEARTYNVSVVASPSVGGNPYVNSSTTTEVSVKPGTRVTLYAPVNPGYKFVKWMVDGADVMNGNSLASSPYTYTVPEADKRFIAVYEETLYKPHSVGIQVATGQEKIGKIGIISPTSAEWTSWNNQSLFIKDWTRMVEVSSTTINEEPVDDYGNYRNYFDSWQVSGAAAGTVTQTVDPAGGTLEYGGDNNVTITAKFGQNYLVRVGKPKDGTLEVTTADGKVISNGTSMFVKAGTRLTLTMTPNKNYYLSTYTINEREQTRYNRPTTVTTTVTVNEDIALQAYYWDPTGIDDIDADTTAAPEQWYTTQGQYLGTQRPTAPGLYIRRSGFKAEKVYIK